MWDMFALSAVLFAVFLFLPGLLFFRAIGMRSTMALAASPILSSAAYSILGMIFSKIGVSSSWELMFLPLATVCAVVFVGALAIRRFRAERRAASARRVFDGRDSWRDWVVLGLFAVVGLAVGIYAFLSSIGSADAFAQEYDNVQHIAAIRMFVETGDWSGLGFDLYPDTTSDGTSLNPIPAGNFYPSAWYCLCAMVVSALGVTIPLAINVVNFVIVTLCFPLGVWLMLRSILGNNRKMLLCGAVCAVAFAAFPWKLVYWGPIYPNLAAFCMAPSTGALFILLFSRRASAIGASRRDMALIDEGSVGLADSRGGVSGGTTAPRWSLSADLDTNRATLLIGFLIGIVALALLQANLVFTLVLILYPFCTFRIYCEARDSSIFPRMSRRSVGLLMAAAFSVLCAILWIVIHYMPFLASVFNFNWGAFVTPSQAVINVLALSFKETSAQILLGLLVVVGAIKAVGNRKVTWILVSYVLACLLYILSATVDDSSLKSLLCGIWYTDQMRLAANAVIAAIPLATLGFYVVARTVARWLARAFSKGTLSSMGALAGNSVVYLVMTICIFFPSYSIYGFLDISTAFGDTRSKMQKAFSMEDNVYTSEEREFVQEALALIPEGALVINEPNDGSAFANGLDGIRLYYRVCDGYDNNEAETWQSAVIRNRLCDIADDPEVRAAVESIGASYVIQLDQSDEETGYASGERYFSSYDFELWRGIDGIDDTTPGFEVVLAKGDMRLYRITA